jgi:peptidyl-prolyl cis-trans isomerase B (cyclophilin B)
VYEDSQLPPDYTVFGRITDGIDVLTEVAEAGTEDGSTDGAPAEPVTIDSLVTEL